MSRVTALVSPLCGRCKDSGVERKNTFLYSSWDAPVSDMKSAKPGEPNSSQNQGVLGLEGQRLGPRFALTAVHIHRMLLLDQTLLHPWGHLGPVMLRRDETLQDYQEIWVNPVFIPFPAGCFEQFNLTER